MMRSEQVLHVDVAIIGAGQHQIEQAIRVAAEPYG